MCHASSKTEGQALQDCPTTSPHMRLTAPIRAPANYTKCRSLIVDARQPCLRVQSLAKPCELPDVDNPANAARSGIGTTATKADKQLRALCTMVAQVNDSGMSWQIMLSSSLPPFPLVAEL